MATEDFDPLVTSVARQASRSFFNSQVATSTKIDPFSHDSAFDSESLRTSRVRLDPSDGDASFKSCESTSSSTSSDHLSVGVGVGISAGSVTLTRAPKLSEIALQTLKYNGGLSAFKERWGDYYVAGYRIGGDAGVMMSLASSSKTISESVTICIKVEILFFSFEDSWSKGWSQAVSDLRVTLSYFSTAEQAQIQEQRQLGDPKLYSFIQEARDIHDRAQGLVDTIQRKLNQIGVSSGKDITTDQCMDLY
ncbi:hypothetical protein FGRMN_686 [Fusarium graminum]|nr:hypothetical protein FGRMN_686 [Fusarium graminum]